MKEYSFDYTDCHNEESNRTCSELYPSWSGKESCVCKFEVALDKPITGPLFLYYSLIGFHQNHMQYVKSRDYYQLAGLSKKPLPLLCGLKSVDENNRPIVPCGGIADTIFNDTFTLSRLIPNDSIIEPIRLSREKITWKRSRQFLNPKLTLSNCSDLECYYKDTVKPNTWPKPIYELDSKQPDNNGFQNEPFIVWMVTAAFNRFRKIYARIQHDTLPKGTYLFTVKYSKWIQKIFAAITERLSCRLSSSLVWWEEKASPLQHLLDGWEKFFPPMALSFLLTGLFGCSICIHPYRSQIR